MDDMHADQSIKTEYITGGDLETHDHQEESEIVKVQVRPGGRRVLLRCAELLIPAQPAQRAQNGTQ